MRTWGNWARRLTSEAPNRAESALGIGLILTVIMSVTLVLKDFAGDFSDSLEVHASVTMAGDTLDVGDIVAYRDIPIGEVSSVTGNVAGGARLTLKLDSSKASHVPSNVTAIALPSSLFGTTRVNLVPTSKLDVRALANGDDIAANTSPAAAGLQTALADVYNLITAVHPAELSAALHALATALDGEGDRIGTLFEHADSYLGKLARQLPTLKSVIGNFAVVTRQLSISAPELLTSVRNLLIVGDGIVANQQAIAQLLNTAPTTVNSVQALLNDTNVNHIVTIVRDEGPILDALAADPKALPKSILALRAVSKGVTKSFNSDGQLSVNLLFTGLNLARIFGLAVPGTKGNLAEGITPPLYTAADCPRYPGLAGPNCRSSARSRAGGGDSKGTRDVTTSRMRTNGTSSTVGSPADLAAIRTAVQSLTGEDIARVPDVAALLVGPLLRGSVLVVGQEAS